MDIFNSFFQNVKDKLTSPFFGTLTVIVLIHHWEFWYTIFNLDSKYTLHEKVSTLKIIADREFLWESLLKDVGWALLIMSIGYVIVIATRSLSLFIDFGIMPGITKRVINKNVVARNEYDELLQERDNYAERYEEERKNGRLLSKGYDEQLTEVREKNKLATEANDQITRLNKDINNLNTSLSQENRKTSKLKNEITNNQTHIDYLEKEVNTLKLTLENHANNLQLFREVFFGEENQTYWKTVELLPPGIETKVMELKNAGLWDGFKKVVYFERRGGSIGTEIYQQLEPYNVLTTEGHERLNSLGNIIVANLDRLDSDIE